MQQKIKLVCLILCFIVLKIPTVYSKDPFVIKDKNFEATCKQVFDADIEIVEVTESGFRVKGSVPICNGSFTAWCYGIKHTWIGKLTYAGYTFDSNEKRPLQFTVDKDKGYLYVKGKGTVKTPNGEIVKLP